MECRVIGIVEIVGAVDSGTALEQYVVTLNEEVDVLEAHVLGIRIKVIENICCDHPVVEIGRLHKRQQVAASVCVLGINYATGKRPVVTLLLVPCHLEFGVVCLEFYWLHKPHGRCGVFGVDLIQHCKTVIWGQLGHIIAHH